MTKLPTSIAVVALGAALVGLLAGGAATVGIGRPGGEPAPAPSRAVWTEAKWPFLLDQWGRGRAFRCAPADCGTEINIYMRPKIGFCNCATGVSDDAELDRVGDLELLSDRFEGLRDGQPIKVGTLNGRSRPYRATSGSAPPLTAIAIGFNDRCDVAAVTVVADHARIAEVERTAIEFLNSELILRWAEVELGL